MSIIAGYDGILLDSQIAKVGHIIGVPVAPVSGGITGSPVVGGPVVRFDSTPSRELLFDLILAVRAEDTLKVIEVRVTAILAEWDQIEASARGALAAGQDFDRSLRRDARDALREELMGIYPIVTPRAGGYGSMPLGR